MKRTVKSFVLRAGRISPRQQFALDNLLPNYILDVNHSDTWDLATLFSRQAETVVEIGFGMGASLLTMAQQHPELNFIGMEVHRAGIGSLIADLHDHNIRNVRVVASDAVEALRQHMPDGSLVGIQIFFPDPWHKKRHNKRRLIQAEFVKLLISKLKPGGFVHCATDWEDYALQMQDVFANETQLLNSQTDGGFAPKPDTRPLTKFEQRGTLLGHGVWDLIYHKVGHLPYSLTLA